jgi:hypothetical protein
MNDMKGLPGLVADLPLLSPFPWRFLAALAVKDFDSRPSDPIRIDISLDRNDDAVQFLTRLASKFTISPAHSSLSVLRSRTRE